jgi:hypothetical protein
VINRTLILTLITLFIFTGIALGDYDLSGSAGAEKLSMSDSTVQSLESDTGSAIADAMAPQVPETQPESQQLALYVSEPPVNTDLQGLKPFNVKTSPSTNVFYDGSYLRWNGFISLFPSTSAGLWIEGSAGWSWYAAMPLGGWSRELLYVPVTSPIFMYDIYPGGFVMRYRLGVVRPGYYYLWYYADTPGRHIDVFGTSSGYSNKVIVDVYTISVPNPRPPKPVPPDPKEECEKNPYCHWVNGQCLCTMPPVPPDPQKECENRGFPWVWEDGQCKMKMAPNPVDECEKTPGCFWADGQCQCPPGPVPNPTPEPTPEPVPNPADQCEKNPNCHWANGQCLCTMPNPTPEPTPGPVPNPTPDDDQSNNA